MSDTATRVVKNSFWLYGRTIASLLLGVFTTRYLLEGLGESDYGLYNVVGGAIGMMGFLSAALAVSTQRHLSYAEGEGDRGKMRKYFSNAVILHNLMGAVLALLFIGAYFIFFNGVLNIPDGQTSSATIVYACMIVTTVFSVTIAPYDAAINAHENMLFYSVVGILDVFLKFGIAIAVLFVAADKLIFYAVLMALESFLIRWMSQLYCKKHYAECKELNLKSSFDSKVMIELTKFAGWQTAAITTSMISAYGMSIVVNHYFGTKMNAAMGVAIQVQGLMMSVSTNLLKALTPVLVKSEGGGNRAQMIRISYEGCKASLMVFSFICIPLLFMLPPALSLWLSEVPAWTASFCLVILISTLTEQTTGFLEQTIGAEGRIKGYCITASILNVPHLIVSAYMFSTGLFAPIWVSINWLAFRVIPLCALKLYYAKKNVGISVITWIKQSLSGVIFGVAITSALALSTKLLLPGINVLLFFILIYLLSIPVYYFFVLNNDEKRLVGKLWVGVTNKFCKQS